jgi:nitroreductase
MDGLAMLYTRRSVRQFKPDPVPADLLEKIILAGSLAATARNVQPWEFVAVTSAALRQRLAGIAENGKFIAVSPVCIAVFCEETKYFLEDGSAATQNLLLAARYFGLGSCWVAGDKKPYAEEIRELCGVAPGKRLISLVAVGFPQDPSVFRQREAKIRYRVL